MAELLLMEINMLVAVRQKTPQSDLAALWAPGLNIEEWRAVQTRCASSSESASACFEVAFAAFFKGNEAIGHVFEGLLLNFFGHGGSLVEERTCRARG
jgi:hypothetical protein